MPATGPESEPSQRRPAEPAAERVTIARLLRTHGRRGELSGISLSGHRERFRSLREVMVAGGEGAPDRLRILVVETVWEHGERLVFKFRGIDSISDAEPLRGAEVQVLRSERFPLPEGEYYQSDLVGCEVVERATGRPAGRVEDFLEEGGNGLLQVRDEQGREILIPFTKAICVEIDVERRRIVIDPPEGLLELNVE